MQALLGMEEGRSSNDDHSPSHSLKGLKQRGCFEENQAGDAFEGAFGLWMGYLHFVDRTLLRLRGFFSWRKKGHPKAKQMNPTR